MAKQTIINVDQKFKQLALSHYGYDGGNIGAKLWFCGLEWGEGIDISRLAKDIDNGPVAVPLSVEDGEKRKRYLTYPFDMKLLKIATTADVRYGQASRYKEYLHKERPYAKEGPLFKLNLYPISFKNTDSSLWTEQHYLKTGLPTKELYIAWVQRERFGFFNALIAKHNPSVVVCCGLSYQKDYLLAFGGVAALFNKPEVSAVMKQDQDFLVFTSPINGHTKIVITRFFGNRWGINKDSECEFVGMKLREYLG